MATMKRRSETRQRLMADRRMLMKTLGDHDAGKLDHLDQRERDHFVEVVKKRIMELNERIAGLDSKL
jgi:hypothetical protein